MNRDLKKGLYIFGGLALATGIFFAVRAIVGDKEDKDLTRAEKEELDRLRKKEEDGTLTIEEKEILDDLQNEIPPSGDDVILGSDDCPSIIGNNTGGRFGCKQVAQLQTAINQKHSNNTADYTGGFQSTYCCTGSDCDNKLAVDGVMGPCSQRAVKKYYNACCECECDWRFLCANYICNCTGCSINSGLWGQIVAGADISDAKLCSEGYTKSCTGTTMNFSGSTNYFNPTRPLNKNGYIQFDGHSNVSGGIDRYENDFGRTGKPKIPQPLTTYRTTGNCNPPCSPGESCVNGICQITTRTPGRSSGGIQTLWRTNAESIPSPIIPLGGDFLPASGPTRYLPPLMDRTSKAGPTRYLPPLMDRTKKEKDPTIFNPNDPDGQHRNFTLSNKQQLRGNTYSDNGLNWREQQGPLGDFYPGQYDFTNDNPPLSNLQHSYGMGKGFGFDGRTSNGNDYISYTNSEDWTEFEAPTQTLDEFYEDVP